MKKQLESWVKEITNKDPIVTTDNPAFEWSMQFVRNNKAFNILKLKNKNFIWIIHVFQDTKLFSQLAKNDTVVLKKALKKGRQVLDQCLQTYSFINLDSNTGLFERLVFESNLLFYEDLTPTMFVEALSKLSNCFNYFIHEYLSDLLIDSGSSELQNISFGYN